MSAPVPFDHLVHTAREFTLREIEIVRPHVVIALGKGVGRALAQASPDLPVRTVSHPAARISNVERAREWAALAFDHPALVRPKP